MLTIHGKAVYKFLATIVILFMLAFFAGRGYQSYLDRQALDKEIPAYRLAVIRESAEQANGLFKNRRNEIASGKIKGFRASEWGIAVELK